MVARASGALIAGKWNGVGYSRVLYQYIAYMGCMNYICIYMNIEFQRYIWGALNIYHDILLLKWNLIFDFLILKLK